MGKSFTPAARPPTLHGGLLLSPPICHNFRLPSLFSLSLSHSLSLSLSDSKTFTKNMRHPPFFLGNTRSTKKTRDPSKCRSARQGRPRCTSRLVWAILYTARNETAERGPSSLSCLLAQAKARRSAHHKKKTQGLSPPPPPRHTRIISCLPPHLRSDACCMQLHNATPTHLSSLLLPPAVKRRRRLHTPATLG